MSDIQWQYIFDPQLALESIPFLLKGLPYTLGIALVSTISGSLLDL